MPVIQMSAQQSRPGLSVCRIVVSHFFCSCRSFLSLTKIIRNITDLALVAGLTEKLINANSKCYQNYTLGAQAEIHGEKDVRM